MIELTLKAATLAELREMVAAFVGTTLPATVVGRGLSALIPANGEVRARMAGATEDAIAAEEQAPRQPFTPKILGNEGSFAVEDVELPKRTRRTKAQIAADEAAEKALLAANAPRAEGIAILTPDQTDTGEPLEDPASDDFDLLGGPSENAERVTPQRAVPTRVITKDDMMKAARAVIDAPKGGFSVLDKLLKGRGFKQVATIPEKSYAAVMADMEEIVGGGV